MARSRRRTFGPLTYGTSLVAVLVLLGARVGPRVAAHWEARKLCRLLGQQDPRKEIRVEERLLKLGPPAASWVMRAMKDPRLATRRSACSILLDAQPEPDSAAPALAAALQDPDPEIRRIAASELGMAARCFGAKISPPPRDVALRALGRALQDPYLPVRTAAAEALWGFGPDAASAVGDLERALDDPDRRVRVAAATALVMIDPHRRPRVVRAMRDLLASPWNESSGKAFDILLAQIGEEAAAQTLISLLHHPDARVRRNVVGFLYPTPFLKRALPELRNALDDPDAVVRWKVAAYLVEIDPTIEPQAMDTLVGSLGDPSLSMSQRLQARSQIIDRSPGLEFRALPALIQQCGPGIPPKTRQNARGLLSLTIGSAATAAITTFQTCANDQDLRVVGMAIRGLAALDPSTTAPLAPTFVAVLKQREASVPRIQALLALRQLGPAGRAALALVEILRPTGRGGQVTPPGVGKRGRRKLSE